MALRKIRRRLRPRRRRPAPGLPNDKGTIRSAVELVQVDVEVTGSDGKPIKGLRQDQFTVSEDSHEQKISTFDYNDVEKIEKAEAADTAPMTIAIGGGCRTGGNSPAGSRPALDCVLFRSQFAAAGRSDAHHRRGEAFPARSDVHR